MEKKNQISVDKYFETYFQHLGTFSWDKAKEFIEKDKQNLALLPSFQAALVQLVQNEKSYFSLEFLEQKWFSRRSDLQLKQNYANLQNTLLAIEKQESVLNPDYGSLQSPDHKTSFGCISQELADFAAARLDCITIYNELSKSVMSPPFEQMCSDIRSLLSSMKIENSVPKLCLRTLEENFVDEMQLLLLLLEASEQIASWNYVQATYKMHSAHAILAKWKPFFANKHSGSFRSGFFGFGEKLSAPSSALYVWFEKFFKALNAKFTFYFFEGLSKTMTSDEMKQSASRLSYDFVNKSLAFAKKNDASSVALFVDTRRATRLPRHGYFFPESVDDPDVKQQPVEDFTCVLTLPPSSASDARNIKQMLSEHANELSYDKLVCQPNVNKKSTSFCAQVDSTVLLAVTMVGLRADKDADVLTYMNDTLQQLRLKRIALLMKPGIK